MTPVRPPLAPPRSVSGRNVIRARLARPHRRRARRRVRRDRGASTGRAFRHTTLARWPTTPPSPTARVCRPRPSSASAETSRGKRVIELGGGSNAVSLARLGARVLVVEPSPEEVTRGRREAEAADVRIEFHESDLADLGFATSGSVDLVISTGSLGHVDDISRVFRQVHRVLRQRQPFVLSLPHPLTAALEGGEVVLRRPYGTPPARTVSAYFTALAAGQLRRRRAARAGARRGHGARRAPAASPQARGLVGRCSAAAVSREHRWWSEATRSRAQRSGERRRRVGV